MTTFITTEFLLEWNKLPAQPVYVGRLGTVALPPYVCETVGLPPPADQIVEPYDVEATWPVDTTLVPATKGIRVLLPTIKTVPDGARLTGVPLTVTAGPPGVRLVLRTPIGVVTTAVSEAYVKGGVVVGAPGLLGPTDGPGFC